MVLPNNYLRPTTYHQPVQRFGRLADYLCGIMTADARRLAHDLNNIAFIIGGYAQRLGETIDTSDPRREDVDHILAAVAKLTDSVDSVRQLGAASRPRPARILLVEDEPAVRELLRHALMRRGYQVETGCTGDEGMALCDSLEPPDLLITDLILPGASGPAIAERLRQRVPGAKVLLMSGYAEHPLLDAAHAAGEPCLVKPFELSTFSDTVQQLLSRAA
jgi:CheY-like chemotaxis protein